MATVKLTESKLHQIIKECITNVLKEEDGNSEFSKKFFQYAKDAKDKKVPNKSVEDYVDDEKKENEVCTKKLDESKLRSIIRNVVKEYMK